MWTTTGCVFFCLRPWLAANAALPPRSSKRLLRGYVKDELAKLLFGAGTTVVLKLTNTALGTADDTHVLTKHGALVPAADMQRDYIDARAYPETEEELFALLRLPYRSPAERNA